ncbi:MAG TPA: metallophosphoesterase [Kofleriaceae bacterium]
MIAYVTDIEGQWDKLVSFASANPHVSLVDDALVLADGVTFVFGGDAIDRGPAGRKIVRTFTAAKRRYGDRVVLLAGNRDINKLRLVHELDEPRANVPKELASHADRLAWILEHTMGAPHAFEFRAAELAAEGRAHDPDAVAQSYLDDLAPDGELRAYLEACQLAYRQGVTLFVHGGVSAVNLFTVPDRPRVDSVDAWIAALNDFYRAQLALDHPATLIAYQAPLPGTHANETSVVYARPTDDVGDPILPPAEVIAALRADGIERVVVGHTPSGDCPAVIRSGDFELVLADNSYGRIEHGSQLAIDNSSITVRGVTKLDDDSIVDVALTTSRHDRGPLGTHDPDGALIKAKLADGRYLLFKSLGEHHVRQTARK